VTYEVGKGKLSTIAPEKGWTRMENDDAPKTMSVPEAGRKLGLGRNGSYAAVERGEIPVLRFGSRFRVPRAAFDRMLVEAKSKDR
jgi:excisionase family DNA binding protein